MYVMCIRIKVAYRRRKTLHVLEVAYPLASVNAGMGLHTVSLATLVNMREKGNLAFHQFPYHTHTHPYTISSNDFFSPFILALISSASSSNDPLRKKRRDPPPAATVLMSICGDWIVTPCSGRFVHKLVSAVKPRYAVDVPPTSSLKTYQPSSEEKYQS